MGNDGWRCGQFAGQCSAPGPGQDLTGLAGAIAGGSWAPTIPRTAAGSAAWRSSASKSAPKHVYSFVLGHHVPHLHIWLVPPYPGTPPEYWPMRLAEWPDAPSGGRSEIEALCSRIRSHLAAI